MPLPPIQPIGVGTAVPHPSQPWSGGLSNWLTPPGNSNPPVIFEPPPGLTGGATEIWIAASGGVDWGGCQVWASSDNATYALVGTIYTGAVTGALTAALPARASPDTTDTLAVDLSTSRGQLLSGTVADAGNLVTLCYVDGELIAYETATLTAPYKYALGTLLVRGAYGTPIGAHAAGAGFARVNAALFRYAYPANLVGAPLYVKMPAFNIFGQAPQSLAAIGSYTYTPTGAGASPLGNPVMAALAGGTAQDWGIAGTAPIGAADLGAVSIATGLDINLGTVP